MRNNAVHLLTHEFPPFVGGIATYAAELAKALAQQAAEVVVWAPDYRGAPAALPAPNCTVRRIRMRGKQDWICRLRMAAALRGALPHGETVILAEPGPIRMWMYHDWLGLPKPKRLVILLHGSELLQLRSKRRFRELLRRVDCIGVVSDAVRELLLAMDPALKPQVRYVPGAVRSDWESLEVPGQICSSPHEPDPAPPQIGPCTLLQVGRMHPRKGQLDFVAALRVLASLPEAQQHLRAGLQARLVGPAGRAAYMRQLQSAAADCGVPVSIEHNCDDAALLSAYRTADVLVLPSRSHRNSLEGLGLVALEAAHFSVPVVACRTGGTADAVRDGVTGLLVPEQDPESLAAAILQLLSSPKLRHKMGQAGREFVRSNFSWQLNAKRLLGITT